MIRYNMTNIHVLSLLSCLLIFGSMYPKQEAASMQATALQTNNQEEVKEKNKKTSKDTPKTNVTTDPQVIKAVSAIDNNQNTEQDISINSLKESIQPEKTIILDYDNQDLVSIINALAAKKGINIVLPQGPNAINVKVTLHMDKKLSINEAWDQLYTILDVAGYSIIPKKDMFVIVKNSAAISRESLSIYIDTPTKDLPSSEERIRFLKYLKNIKVSEAADSELSVILKGILPPNTTYKMDQLANSLLVVAKANEIRSLMHIIDQLDLVEFQETMEIIPLHHSSARVIADLFNENILKPVNEINRYRLDTRKQPTDASYFSRYTRIIADERTNSLIVLGRTHTVNRMKDFIYTYIDVELDSGKSILHIYRLQYLDAQEFEPVLKRIVESTKPGGAEQARAGGAPTTGIERFFDEVIIKADKPDKPEEQRYYGGNKLVIAARNDDWKRIRKLIEELDTPQPQVLMEVLIADLTIEDQRLLGAMARNPDKIPLPNKVNFQSAQLPPGALTDNSEKPTTIAADLLRKAFNNDGQPTEGSDATRSIASFTQPGGSVISFSDNDGETWGILQILKLFDHTKILSHPHVIATNNEEATVRIGEERLLQGAASGVTGGAAVQKFDKETADTLVVITPRISSADTVNLQVEITVNEFVGGGNQRATRIVSTNANVASGSILALGGLIRSRIDQSVNEAPVLGKVPIIGWFFKRRAGNTSQNNLTVFIAPTVIQPRLRAGVGEYTKDYIKVAKNYTREGELFETLKDPITRWFFKTGMSGTEIVDEFFAKDEFAEAYATTRPPTKKKKKKKKDKKYSQNPVTIISKNEQADKIKELYKNEQNPLLKTRQQITNHLQS